MQLIALATKKPSAVFSIIAMVILFGLLALKKIPIQLIPDINKPIIQITTVWPGAAPFEIEREIINRQEEELKGISGIKKITSNSTSSRGEITLEFGINQNMDKALILVANRLDRITDYPAEVDKPLLKTASSEDNPIAWFIMQNINDSQQDITKLRTLINDNIQDYIERVPGIARVNVYGGSETELQIIVDANNLAKYNLTVTEVLNALRVANASISGGDISEGKRRYVIRTQADIDNIYKAKNVVIKSIKNEDTNSFERVYVKDIAKVQFGLKKPASRIRSMGNNTIVFNAIRETKSNVIETMESLKAAVNYLNANVLPAYDLRIKQVYDETIYINSAIDLVQQNILIGGLLAACILWIFLRQTLATVIIALAIPISVIGSFVAIDAMGRSINVISLAGFAFAVGLSVDAAIVVLENIYRLQQSGMSKIEAAITGARDVWGAILVSSLTTVMVFLPILTLELEVGQLFRDIAVAISVSVMLSLLVASLVIPALYSGLFKKRLSKLKTKEIPILDNFASFFSHKLILCLKMIFNNRFINISVICCIILFSVLSAIVLLPKLEYLPEGNRNLIFGVILPPPGYNIDSTFAIANKIEDVARPLWQNEGKIKNFFFVALTNTALVGAVASDPKRVKELIPILSRPIFQEPGTYGFISQSSLFGRGIGDSRSIDIDIQGYDLNDILGAASMAMGLVQQALPREMGHQYRPIPGLELGAPEIRITPDNTKIIDNNLSNTELGIAVRVFTEGVRADEITVAGKRIDLTVKGNLEQYSNTQDINDIQLTVQGGKTIPISSVADINLTAGPTEIRHKNNLRTVTIQVKPSAKLALESAVNVIQTEVIDKLRPKIDRAIKISASGTADELSLAWNALSLNFLVAIVIVYLVMAILLENFFYPIIILLAVPVATTGGILGLATLNLFTYQPLDMLTLLGFIILIGIVVNNAILLVMKSISNIDVEDMSVNDAIIEATRQRLRPIFMSTLTSLFGMLPLVLFPGAGSELYRGLGSVILGGLSLSAMIILFLIPALLKLVFEIKNHSS